MSYFCDAELLCGLVELGPVWFVIRCLRDLAIVGVCVAMFVTGACAMFKEGGI